MAQAKLDGDLWKGGSAPPENADFTSQGFGLLTDVVNGGLKTDLSLGFEMSDGDFKLDTWGAFKNPFRFASATLQFPTPATYKGQRPLFRPLSLSGSVNVSLSYTVASTSFEYPAAAIPTFDTLRSFYCTPCHLYTTADGPTVFERGMDNVALKQPPTTTPIATGKTPPASFSQTSYRPVLDRIIYVLSMAVGADKEVRLIITPVVTLWNPYNALEIEGAVVYPWMAFPFTADWTFYKSGVAEPVRKGPVAGVLGAQFVAGSNPQGRQVDPYFFASITSDGSGTASAGQAIRFKPGEVRVFAPAQSVDLPFVSSGTVRQRTLNLMPVNNASQLSGSSMRPASHWSLFTRIRSWPCQFHGIRCKRNPGEWPATWK